MDDTTEHNQLHGEVLYYNNIINALKIIYAFIIQALIMLFLHNYIGCYMKHDCHRHLRLYLL